MSKSVTISSLVRQAAKSEADFVATVEQVFAEETTDRIAEFFDRLNIPRSIEGEDLTSPIPMLQGAARDVGTFDDEQTIAVGVQKYMDRHLKKLKWHAQRPSSEGTSNVLLIMREAMIVTDLRLSRVQALLRSKDELTPEEWAIARDLMTKAYAGFRHFLTQFGGTWVDAVSSVVERAELEGQLGNFYEVIDHMVRRLEEHREKIEARRGELTVMPRGFDPVKPPIYFGGDLMGRGPWKQFWAAVEDRAHHFREALA